MFYQEFMVGVRFVPLLLKLVRRRLGQRLAPFLVCRNKQGIVVALPELVLFLPWEVSDDPAPAPSLLFHFPLS